MSGDLQQAISLIKAGRKEEGKTILIQILEEDERNEKAWIWMSAVVDTDEMRLECLEEVLKINPSNQVAQKGAAKLREKLPPPSPTFDDISQDDEYEYENAYEDDFSEDDGWYDPIEPEPVTGYQEEFSYDNYAPEPNPDIKIKSTQNKPRQRSVLTHSPWLTIWYQPRATLRAIIQSNPKQDVILIAILVGLLSFFSGILPYLFSDLTFLIIGMLLTLILGPISGIIWLYVIGWILGLTGMMLGGKGTGEEIRAALSWGNVPSLGFSVILIPINLIFYSIAPNPLDPTVTAPGDAGIVFLLGTCTLLLIFVMLVYSFGFVFLQSLAEAHRFSAWRALGAVMLPGIIVFCTFCFVITTSLFATSY